MVRDLTLRSAHSFGSFHLIRLLFDEYLFYLTETRSAKATDSFPLKILGEVSNSQNKVEIVESILTLFFLYLEILTIVSFVFVLIQKRIASLNSLMNHSDCKPEVKVE